MGPSYVLSLKYDVDAYMATLSGGEPPDLLISRVGLSKSETQLETRAPRFLENSNQSKYASMDINHTFMVS